MYLPKNKAAIGRGEETHIFKFRYIDYGKDIKRGTNYSTVDRPIGGKIERGMDR